MVPADLPLVPIRPAVRENVQRMRCIHERHHRSTQSSAVCASSARGQRVTQRGVAHSVEPRAGRHHGVVALGSCECKVAARLQHHHATHKRVEHAAVGAMQGAVLAKGGRKASKDGRYKAVVASKCAWHDVAVHHHVAHAALGEIQLGQHVVRSVAVTLRTIGVQRHASRRAKHCRAAKRVYRRDVLSVQHPTRTVHQQEHRCEGSAEGVAGEGDGGEGAAVQVLLDEREEAVVERERGAVDAAVHLDPQRRRLKGGGVKGNVGDPGAQGVGALDYKVAGGRNGVVAYKPFARAAARGVCSHGPPRLHHLPCVPSLRRRVL
mmetsp:Transcript_23062/g.40943  ORF Transcript_23062/g.40943 Transcript_23062/m.40943 type:complete len:321 (-) Transcript_23062:1682-2644(-)